MTQSHDSATIIVGAAVPRRSRTRRACLCRIDQSPPSSDFSGRSYRFADRSRCIARSPFLLKIVCYQLTRKNSPPKCIEPILTQSIDEYTYFGTYSSHTGRRRGPVRRVPIHGEKLSGIVPSTGPWCSLRPRTVRPEHSGRPSRDRGRPWVQCVICGDWIRSVPKH